MKLVLDNLHIFSLSSLFVTKIPRRTLLFASLALMTLANLSAGLVGSLLVERLPFIFLPRFFFASSQGRRPPTTTPFLQWPSLGLQKTSLSSTRWWRWIMGLWRRTLALQILDQCSCQSPPTQSIWSGGTEKVSKRMSIELFTISAWCL